MSDIRLAYYCKECFDFLVEAASEHIPSLAELTGKTQSKESAAQSIGVLTGLREGVSTAPMTYISDSDRRLYVPSEVLMDKSVFGRFHLTGAALDAYKQALEAARGSA